MTQNLVRYEYDAGAARITLADGERGNALGLALVDQLLDAVRQAGRDAAKVIVLAADGRFFSVGGDLAAFGAAQDRSMLIDDLAEALHRVVSELIRSDAIVVSVVQGTAAGAGFPLAAVGDVVLASDTAKFSLAYTKVGLSPDGGSSLLVQTLGLHRTLRLALLGDLLSAQEAYDAGLVARVVPADELPRVVDQVVGARVAGSAPAQASAKRLLREAAAASPETALRRESLSIRTLVGTADGVEGITAFLEKRAPSFGQADATS
ncbi:MULTISPECIES: enoyl-CoA hydratase/isomerase family protein [Nocardioides]|uniref:Enoyl-CoA hydratase/isomerase family protein n=1 Tax=Nocardioides vastitatis TaxID=2568655 RepID=A0ABW0ZIY0_9ACTN|nr:enoyl-CoA hydratase-related protein [Nocardioides sp.]THI97333.1 enoyl-CoA hydratase [Nocardioides sp.]